MNKNGGALVYNQVAKRLKKTAVPSLFKWTKVRNGSDERRKRIESRSNTVVASSSNVVGDIGEDIFYGCMDKICLQDDVIVERSISDDFNFQIPVNVNAETVETATQTLPLKQYYFSSENFKDDSAGIHFYTGLEFYAKFLMVFQSLGAAVHHLHAAHSSGTISILPAIDQFFLTLIKFRQHKTNFELSRMFGISEFSDSNIFITWVCFMFKQWSELNIWPPREVVYYYSPKDFKSKFPATRCIVVGTEIPIKKPKPPLTQQATFSTYKNQNTVKTLVSATPAGLIVDITKAYGGSTSDRQIIERGGLVSMCDPGDSIMADKGFNVQDIFAPKNVTVNIPSFFRKKTDFQVILF
ncbi:hypothetical protein LOTGIDRAFT_153356 [Lottia gigantea]|uniref:DDE Tnp4 domain-containing protein n=1 Tax=Lottia gigantea TaxID=225164 RepID=V4AAT5_LOTGI|nr:hypothetical protein LOTGIDRAFT_153356 [Lottia gigantea]ESO93882.1 hypothetical protein LOTGIDRAFT_153356 [Lottia gigantea]